ncbi:MAG: hypothetical protein IIA59_10855 [Candidatus Marinimicrobia bacterium]|nr:hypothetical protein [Candidatus Neomarinimicrobiota bacterium]
MKIIDPFNVTTFDLKEAISHVLGARIQLGQTLYFTFNTINMNMKKVKYSLTQFLRIISISYPQMSTRTLLRSYRVYERIVLGTGCWASDLEQIHFVLLARIAECNSIGSLTRRELVQEVQQRMEAGDSYAQISKKLDGILAHYREHPPRIPEGVQEFDRRLADVKMSFNLTESVKDEPAAPFRVPENFPGLDTPPVVIPKSK